MALAMMNYTTAKKLSGRLNRQDVTSDILHIMNENTFLRMLHPASFHWTNITRLWIRNSLRMSALPHTRQSVLQHLLHCCICKQQPFHDAHAIVFFNICVPECPHEVPPILFVFFSFCLILHLWLTIVSTICGLYFICITLKFCIREWLYYPHPLMKVCFSPQQCHRSSLPNEEIWVLFLKLHPHQPSRRRLVKACTYQKI